MELKASQKFLEESKAKVGGEERWAAQQGQRCGGAGGLGGGGLLQSLCASACGSSYHTSCTSGRALQLVEAGVKPAAVATDVLVAQAGSSADTGAPAAAAQPEPAGVHAPAPCLAPCPRLTHVLHRAGREITKAAEECGCESLVMGSRGLGLSKKALFSMLGVGSVSDYVLKHAHCNVVL